ncbi:glycosyltransferase family 4 protein [Spirillospora sp. NPDC047279]|uniref:glycosyltransferase family 4 protein n=1 Tax=Spirillospora sp. NPDC047279 TaxID=3155478 RepID=UPI0033D5AC26
MRILVYPHAMEIGGSQLNAIELAAAVRDLGHEVAVAGEPGPLVERVRAAGIEHLPLDPGRRRPSPATVRMLRGLAADRGFDVVHGYEWPPGLEAFHAARGRRDLAAVCTVMSMSVAPFLPPSLPLVVGTEDIRRTVLGRRGRRPGAVHLIEPPVDVRANAPDHPAEEFRQRFRLDGRALDVVVVCRLVAELKLEGLLTAIDVIGTLDPLPLRLVIVGDGPCRAQVESRATEVNARLGRRAVILTGELDDPRPAYAAASIALGMGGSALRALAFARPLIVQGEHGFFELLTPETAEIFLDQGWYGVGGPGATKLAAVLRDLATDEVRRKELGDYGRRLVTDRFSLERAARVQVEIYTAALAAARGGPDAAGRWDAVSTVGRVAAYKVRRKAGRFRGSAARDDFNAVARRPRG